jgi:L-ascorbate metabolism protein UlaG (beta-lactamase superfamily)
MPIRGVSVEVVNHASVIIRAGDVALLTDPWYVGTAFRGGWGLQWENPKALDRIRDCTHLWVSHVHSDHFQAQTLRDVAAAAPQITVLVNRSANVDIAQGLRAAGFTKLEPLPERRRISIGKDIAVTRYPSTAIDSMLFIETPSATVLDLNDCNMPAAAFRQLRRRMGRVDVLLVNYNHAGKLYDYPSHDAVRRAWSERFVRTVEPFEPRWIIPFASAHYYRTEHTREQNESLLALDDVRRLDRRVLPVEIGCTATFRSGAEPVVTRVSEVRGANREVHAYSRPTRWEELVAAARAYRARLRREFFGQVGWLRPVRFLASDHDRVLVFDPRAGVGEGRVAEGHHVAAHSEALLDLLTRPNGADGFFVGGHFAFGGLDRDAVQKLHLAGSLLESSLAPRQALGLLARSDGRAFYWNRREEAWAVLAGRRVRTWDRT